MGTPVLDICYTVHSGSRCVPMKGVGSD
jgi:hypothetical protein